MKIPFLDLVTPHIELEEELIAVVRKTLRTAHFIGGEEVENFEKEFASFCEVPHCIGVSSGTDALRFALLAAGIGKGDTVVTVPNTFIATTEAISQAGGEVAFVDIDERTYNMDPAKLKAYLETHPKTKAVLPVHLYGQMCDMDAILDLAEKYNLIVIEDACQAHGAQYFSKKHNRWFKAGSMGKAGAFSFYPGKNLGACGEGGAVTTSDPEIAKKVQMLRDHGQAKKYYHDFEGYNGRLDAIQAGFLRVKLRHLEEWNTKRREAAARYKDLLSGVVIPYEPDWSRAIYHLYIVRAANREALQKKLTDAGIGTGLHYPVPLHMQNAYNSKPGEFPVAEKATSEILSLPMFPQLTAAMQEHVASQIKANI
ncbi:MAG: DegT/DnrJ/EryC1/StrS family aminotransferase [Acidobacteria bacterium]|nr:DegT/DnrJ/EryC1/StrS family aminotransferase [Acidobacteriota bacterium]